MLGPVNRLMAGYAQCRSTTATMDELGFGVNRGASLAASDPAMVVQPTNDPGYAMPNVDIGNPELSRPGEVVTGWLPANATQGMDPTDPRYPAWLQMMRQSGVIR